MGFTHGFNLFNVINLPLLFLPLHPHCHCFSLDQDHLLSELLATVSWVIFLQSILHTTSPGPSLPECSYHFSYTTSRRPLPTGTSTTSLSSNRTKLVAVSQTLLFHAPTALLTQFLLSGTLSFCTYSVHPASSQVNFYSTFKSQHKPVLTPLPLERVQYSLLWSYTCIYHLLEF